MPTALRPSTAAEGLRPAVLRARLAAAGPAGFDLAAWAAGVAVGTAVVAAVASQLHAGATPFVGRYGWRLTAASVLAPAVAVAVLVAARRGLGRRLAWHWLLVAAYLAALAFTLGLGIVAGGSGLAAPLTRPGSFAADVPPGATFGSVLAGFLPAAARHTLTTRQHPPGPLLLLTGLHQAGLTDPVATAVVLTGIGAAAVPLVATAVRSLCHEPAARALLPVLVLAPYARWSAASMDAVTGTVAAAAIAAAVAASERHRSFGAATPWALAAGVLLGAAALFSYSAAWLGATVIVVYFVRRRPLLNLITAAGTLGLLAAVARAGFSWAAGLAHSPGSLAGSLGPSASWLLWGAADLLVVAIAAGPALAAAARKLRRTPGWPFVVGAGLAVASAIASGLFRGGVEHSFLPFFPWLLVPAVAPERRGEPPGRVLALAGVGAAVAVVLAAVLRSPW